MPCYHPIEIFIKRKTLYSKRGMNEPQVVPCGSCVGCRAEQGRQWAVRMMHESRMHQSNVFITLTYDDEEIPENGSLCPEDFQGFIKRLRKTQEAPLSFFGCGEYGPRTQRSHYHALLFGVEFLDRDIRVRAPRDSVWHSKALDDLWGMGRTEGGTVTMASASYVAGYIRKKVKTKDFVRANRITGELLQPEFSRMSLRPAIGNRWISKYWRDVYPRDYIVVEGFKAKPPRYYDKWMDGDHPKFVHNCHEHRLIMQGVRERRVEEAEYLSQYSMDAAEATLTARVKLFAERDAL